MHACKAPIAIALLLACVVSRAAESIGPELQLAVTDPRPVAKAIAVLSERHGIAITYEDPRYEFQGDLVDVTREVSRTPLKQGQKVLIPRGGAIELTYSVSSSTGKPEHVDALIRKVLDAHAASGRGSQFEVIEDGNVFHVVPVMIRNTQGAWMATSSVLDTPISVPVQQRSGVQMVDAICEALTAAAKVRVTVGAQPLNAMANEQIVDGGTNEPARDILSRSLKRLSTEAVKRFGTGVDRQYVWQLLLDPATSGYFLNLSLVMSQPEPPAKPSEDSPPDPTAPDPTTARPLP